MWIEVFLAGALTASAASPADDAQLYTTPYFQTLGVAAGMPSSRIYKTVQDRDGYLWFGTQDGLARYDGVGFRVYRHDPKDPDSLGGNAVTALFVDRDNRIWCGGEESGLNMLDAGRNRFTHYRHDANDPASLGADDVWTITQDESGAIWTGSYAGGLDRLDPGARGFAHFRHDSTNPQSISSDNVLGLLPQHGAGLWVGSDVGIDLIETGSNIRHVDFAGLPGSGRVNAITLLDAGDGSVLAGTRRGLVRIDSVLKASIVAADGLTDKLVYGLTTGASGELWVATRHGLNRLVPRGDIAKYVENPAVPGAFPGDTVFDAMRDREGNLWFATLEGGAVKLPAAWRNFSLYRNDPGNSRSLSANRTLGLAAGTDGSVWAVNWDGRIDRLDPLTGAVERLAESRLSVPDKSLWSVLPDRHGQLWVGHEHGLRVYELQSGQYVDIPVDAAKPDALAPGLIYHLAEDSAGPVWVSTYGSSGALHRIDPASHRVERFDADNAGLRNAEVDQIGFDSRGSLLVASGAGLDRFDGASRRFSAIAGAPGQRVYAFAFARDGTLWLHILGALEHYRVVADALALIERVDAAAGWPALTVGGLQVDDAGAVWVSSARGLWRYDPAAHAIRVFDSRDGLASSEFNRLPLSKTADGAIFGGTLAGIVGFVPSRIVENSRPPAPVFDSLVVRRGGRDQPLDPAAKRNALLWDDRDVRVSARALSYANPAANRYQWRLEGIDPDWIDTGNRGEREFSQLPPGDYRLQVRAAGAAAIWSDPGAPLELRVAPPPWATPLAYAGYAVALAFVVLLAFRGYRLRIKRRYALALAEQQQRFAEQASAAKTEFLATMGHEIRTPMTGVLGMAELLLRTPLDPTQQGYARTILDSGRMMLRLVNDSLDLARIEAGKLELEDEPFDLRVLVAEMAAIAAPLARNKGLAWRTAVTPDAPRFVRGDPVRVKQILLNLVNNAIKFTEHGAVALDLARGAGGTTQLRVSDSGPGIAESTRARLFQRFEQADGARRHGGSGLGLAICRELVACMHGEISLDSEPGRGSTFFVNLPLREVAADTGDDRVSAGPAAAPAGWSRPLRILLVEDDPTVAEVIARLLELHGNSVKHAAQGLAALTEFDAARYDAALIDLDLPGVDGLSLARMLRAREAQLGAARMPLIGVSARSAGNEESLCLAAGMDAFLRKPVTGELLARALAEFVDRDATETT
jgi:signal transduction histidine kinase/streptogramin lyase/ActR/RegA family two-component response regulator